MTTARLIEYRTTRRLLRRRELESQRRPTDTFIKGLALIAGIGIASVVIPQLLMPIFVICLVLILGL